VHWPPCNARRRCAVPHGRRLENEIGPSPPEPVSRKQWPACLRLPAPDPRPVVWRAACDYIRLVVRKGRKWKKPSVAAAPHEQLAAHSQIAKGAHNARPAKP
jgi:hypothetical protein